jgi:hypothetical protein
VREGIGVEWQFAKRWGRVSGVWGRFAGEFEGKGVASSLLWRGWEAFTGEVAGNERAGRHVNELER